MRDESQSKCCFIIPHLSSHLFSLNPSFSFYILDRCNEPGQNFLSLILKPELSSLFVRCSSG